jgi:hypothetical protein
MDAFAAAHYFVAIAIDSFDPAQFIGRFSGYFDQLVRFPAALNYVPRRPGRRIPAVIRRYRDLPCHGVR